MLNNRWIFVGCSFRQFLINHILFFTSSMFFHKAHTLSKVKTMLFHSQFFFPQSFHSNLITIRFIKPLL
ncbi:hypothetical protein CW304_15475 [Bacillus sp. UFRGS-B20]|nr:hypothetical protein CW304_15475 [Bacillus sp. UFRGS-B20]